MPKLDSSSLIDVQPGLTNWRRWPMRWDYGTGLIDIQRGLTSWRTWSMLAWNDIRRRYRRSSLGQFWLTLSMAMTIGGLGFVYSHLFRTDVTSYLPYLAVTFVSWGIISSLVNESCTAFSENENLLRQLALPRSIFIFRVIARTFMVAAHNALIIPVVFIYFGVGVNMNLLWLAVGLALVIVNGFWFGFFIAIVCARFRDVPQIVTNVMQVVFFITPVMFQPELLPESGRSLMKWNPFANFLEVLRDPILGVQPSSWALTTCFLIAVVGFVMVVPFASRYAPRVVYWL